MYKILIVDDEKMIRMGIQKSIPWSSLQIDETYTAASAKEAMEILKNHHPDIMVTDISMTEMTGLELVEQIRREATDLRIIVLTGYDKFEYARQALQLRVHDFLLKPIDEIELTKSIQLQVEELEKLRISREAAMAVKRTQGVHQQASLEACMREFLHGKKLEEKEEVEFFSQFHFDKNQMMKIGILLPDMQVMEDKEAEDLRHYTVKNICMSLVDEKNDGITFSDDKGRTIIAFFCGENGTDIAEEAEQLIDILGDEYNVKPRLVLGSENEGFENLNISYNDALFLLENERETFRDIIKPCSEKRREDIFLDVFREFKQSMVGNISDVEKVLHIFERFQMAVKSYNLSLRDVRRCCFELASAVYFAYFSDSGNNAEESLNSLSQSLTGTDRESACEVTGMFLQKLLTREDGEEHELVRKVKKRIRENLADDLTVASIAAELYVTPNYLSRLFKKVTGEGCNEYIVGKRMEKAKSLLETTTLKAGEISVMVGYHDMNYFSLAFKKHAGVSPTKYRDGFQRKHKPTYMA